ncbi:MAG: tetratricopeptide repeat protein [Smithella sp.]
MSKTVDLEQILKEKNESLYNVLNDIEKFSRNVWKERLLPWFTNHNTDHSKEIIHLLGQILSPLIDHPDFLTDHELFILLVSAYLHDIGMQNLKVSDYPVDALTAIQYDLIRKRHAEESYNIITKKVMVRDDFYLPKSLNEDYVYPIALVSKGHSTPLFVNVIDELKSNPLTPMNRPFRGELLTAHVTVQNGTIEITLNFPNNAETYQHMFKQLIEDKLTKQIELVNPFLREATKGLLNINHKIFIKMTTGGVGKIKRDLPPDVFDLLASMQSKKTTSTETSIECGVRAIFPKPSPIFTGREVELKQFKDAFTIHNFISIEGFGGIGKTEFAAKCLEEFCSKDSVVWFECLPDSKLDTLIDFAGYKDVLKGENKTELAKYSGFVDLIERDKKTLFLDNFQDALNKSFSDFFAFAERKLRSAKFIFMSREHPQIQIKAVSVPLEGLKDDSFIYARKLIKNYYSEIKVDDSSLKKLCDQLDGHPLAIDFALQLIRYGESPTDIIPKIAQFKGSELSNRLLAEVFDHPKSTAIEKKLMLRFSVFRREIDKNGLTHIMDGVNIDETVRMLIDKKMLALSQQNQGYYNVHPLVREFCYLRLDSIEKNNIHIKVANYLTTFRNEKFDPVLEEEIFHHYYTAKALEDSSSIISRAGEAFILFGHTNSLKAMMDRLIASGVEKSLFDIYYGDIATIHGEWDHALKHFEKASSSEDEKVMAEAYIKFGEILYRKGYVKESLKYFDDAYTISKKKEYTREQARALNDIGLVCKTQGDLSGALENINASLKIREEIDDKIGIAISLNNIGSVYHIQGNFLEALEKHNASLKIREEIGDKIGIASSFNNIGLVYHTQGNFSEALEKHKASLKMNEEIGNKEGIAAALHNIGSVYQSQDNISEALEKHEASLKITEEIGRKEGIAAVLNNIGSIYRNQKNLSGALEKHKASMKIYEEVGNKDGIATVFNNIGLVYQEQDNLVVALEKYETSLKITKEIGHKQGVATLYGNIAIIQSRQKKYDFALSNLLKSLSLETQMGISIDHTVKNIKLIRNAIGLDKFKKIFMEQMIKLPDDLKGYCQLPIELLQNNTVKHNTLKVGRNDPCPCGSGKKYKKCCGK